MPEWLTRKYGPLAAWQWAALGAGGFVLYRYYKARKAAAASTSSTAGTTTTASGYQPQTPPTATVSLPGGGSYSGPSGDLSSILGQLQPTGTTPSDQINFSTPGGATYSGPAGSVPSGLLAGSPAAAPGAPASGTSAPPVLTSSGFYTAPSGTLTENVGGQTYTAFTNPAQLGSYYASGGQAYVQPAPNIFVPYNPSAQYPGGTTVFAGPGQHA